MKKRLLSAVLAIALLLSFVPAHAAGSASLSVSSATLAEGETTAKLSVSLDANSGDLALLSFTLDYDKTALTLSKFSAGDVWDETDGSATAKKTTGKFNWYCGEQGYDITGEVATVEFTVNEGAAPGVYTIGLTGITASDYSEVKMETTVTAGTITIPDSASSDVLNLTVSSDELAEGETTAKLSVTLDANPGNLALLSFTLDYDSTALTLSKFSAGDVWDETDGSATAKKTTGKFNWYCGEQGYDITGVVATMEFTVNEGAAPGDYTINLTGITASDYDEVKMETSVVAGTIKVPAPAGPTYTTTALKYADGALTLEAAEAITGKVVVVSYTDSGKRLVQAQFIDVNVAADSATPITFNVAAGTSYKAMLWLDNVNCKPLIDAIGW